MWLYDELLRIVGDAERVSVNGAVLEQHSKGISYHSPLMPDVVVFPATKEEVSRIMRFANENKVAVVPFGAGSSLEGHIIPLNGGISLDFTLMNEIISVRPDDFIATVQPGVTRNQLNQALKKYGLFFPVDPGADATIGGMTATNASGTNTVKYGVMRDQVLGLELVLADGSSIRTGGYSYKSSAGYNLTGLFVGSEGTLGVFTEIILKLQGIPETTIDIKATFPSIEAAGIAATVLLKAGLPIGKIELVDQKTIQAVNAFKNTSYREEPTLFMEFSGSEPEVMNSLEIVQEIIKDEQFVTFEFENDSIKRAQLWEARHQAALAIIAANPGKGHMVTDVCVPLSELSDALQHTRKIVDQYGIDAVIFGHVGDGNYHAVFSVDTQDEEHMKQVEEVHTQIVQYALSKGGTCTGEHGIGLGKKKFLQEEHGDTLFIMKGIKTMVDPNNILNPGKIFDDVPLSAPFEFK
ncbi:FAD-binding oxidoreductase [Neobacillus rhizophilus]|uniref:D-lactate dehydrogenase (cytochrome) n=1 Tax=Neobacillus rhizophilus TaxID=2833579 RepID=A0A942YXX6_9BACI|nr:FAD-linked oxidase C-terminal domain-containing protein [Neobacillus rhizophilus]MBS4216432.1 FAD-binding protein [Neobacillus rhizophilus]